MTMIKVNAHASELMTDDGHQSSNDTQSSDMYDITYDLRNWLALFDDFLPADSQLHLYLSRNCFNIPAAGR